MVGGRNVGAGHRRTRPNHRTTSKRRSSFIHGWKAETSHRVYSQRFLSEKVRVARKHFGEAI